MTFVVFKKIIHKNYGRDPVKWKNRFESGILMQRANTGVHNLIPL